MVKSFCLFPSSFVLSTCGNIWLLSDFLTALNVLKPLPSSFLLSTCSPLPPSVVSFQLPSSFIPVNASCYFFPVSSFQLSTCGDFLLLSDFLFTFNLLNILPSSSSSYLFSTSSLQQCTSTFFICLPVNVFCSCFLLNTYESQNKVSFLLSLLSLLLTSSFLAPLPASCFLPALL